jgi:glucosamine--fructose-6-phosphate aminotransferase (isomerizing)
VNAHPHYDHKQRVAIIHNGLIENYQSLKDELRDTYNLTPLSQTDTEIVAIYIGIFLDKGFPLQESITKCLDILEGAYTFVLISILEPDALYIIKNTGTVVIGVSKGLQGANASSIHRIHEDVKEAGKEEEKEGDDEHKFQIVASDTSVF